MIGFAQPCDMLWRLKFFHPESEFTCRFSDKNYRRHQVYRHRSAADGYLPRADTTVAILLHI